MAARLYFPIFVVAITAFAVFGSQLDLAGALRLPPAANPPLQIGLALPMFYGAVAALERLWPYRKEWNEPHDDVRTDAFYLLVSGPAVSVLYGATFAVVAATGAAWLSQRLGGSLWPAAWPALAQLFLAILVAELGHYWFHRLSHESPLVWRLHATHHSAERLYWLNATRFHPLDLLCLIACQSVPLVLLGATPHAIAMYTIFQAAYGQLQHGNIAMRTGALDWIFSTPGLHRFHHSTDSREGNANYGAILIAWDLLFGTFHRPHGRDFAGPVGIGKLPKFPPRFAAQLASPFRWRSVVAESYDR